MDNQATESPLQSLPMKYSEQLAVMLTFQACVKSGVTYTDIARRHRHREGTAARKQAWDRFIEHSELPKNFGIALADSGLFTPDVEKILDVVNDAEHAPSAVIEYLRIIGNRESGSW